MLTLERVEELARIVRATGEEDNLVCKDLLHVIETYKASVRRVKKMLREEEVEKGSKALETSVKVSACWGEE